MCDDGTGLTALYLHYTGTAGVLVHCDKDKINLRCDNLRLIFFPFVVDFFFLQLTIAHGSLCLE